MIKDQGNVLKEKTVSINEKITLNKDLIIPPVNTVNSQKNTLNQNESLKQSGTINNSLPLFMISHIQSKQKQSNVNKIYPENSPERKSHDMMLLSPSKKRNPPSQLFS